MEKTTCENCGKYGGHIVRPDNSGDVNSVSGREYKTEQVCGYCHTQIDRSTYGGNNQVNGSGCLDYDCTGSLSFVEGRDDLYICSDCPRYQVATAKSSSGLYVASVCACCEKTTTQLQFHHWDYETDEGVYLCDECHSHIHREMRAREQARLSGVESWESDAISRLKARHEDYHGKVSKKMFNERYFIPRKLRDVDD